MKQALGLFVASSLLMASSPAPAWAAMVQRAASASAPRSAAFATAGFGSSLQVPSLPVSNPLSVPVLPNLSAPTAVISAGAPAVAAAQAVLTPESLGAAALPAISGAKLAAPAGQGLKSASERPAQVMQRMDALRKNLAPATQPSAAAALRLFDGASLHSGNGPVPASDPGFRDKPEALKPAGEATRAQRAPEAPKPPKKKRLLLKIGAAVTLLAAGLAVAYILLAPRLRPVDPGDSTVIVGKIPYSLVEDHAARVDHGQGLYSLLGHAGVVRSVSARADGKAILTTDETGAWKVWDLETGKAYAPKNYPGKARTALFADGGKSLILIDQDATIRVVNLATGEARTIGTKLESLKFSAVSPDAQRVTLVTAGKVVHTVTLKDGKADALLADGSVLALGSSDRGELLLTSKRGLSKLWLVRPGQAPEVIIEKYLPGIQVLGSALSRDGKTIFFVADMAGDRMIVAWPFGAPEAAGLTYLSAGDFGEEALDVAGIDASEDGKIAAFALKDGRVYVWPGQGAPKLVARAAGAEAVFLAPDGKTVFISGRDGRLQAWTL